MIGISAMIFLSIAAIVAIRFNHYIPMLMKMGELMN